MKCYTRLSGQTETFIAATYFGQEASPQLSVSIHFRVLLGRIFLVAKVGDKMTAWIREKTWTLMMEDPKKACH
jgi:hypothetical protein